MGIFCVDGECMSHMRFQISRWERCLSFLHGQPVNLDRIRHC